MPQSTPKPERRFLFDTPPLRLEVRGEGDDRITRLEGYAAVFYDGTPATEYKLFKDVTERIMPGAFDRALKEKDDVRALFNHDPNMLLARTSAGTLNLSADKRGLAYGFAIDWRDTDHERVARKVERGDLTGSSFGFSVEHQEWIEQGDMVYREIRSVHLYDASPVTFPAYEATQVAVRSAQEAGVPEQSQTWFYAAGRWNGQTAKEIIRRFQRIEARIKQIHADSLDTG